MDRKNSIVPNILKLDKTDYGRARGTADINTM